MSVNVPFMTPGKASSLAANKANLGKLVISNGKMYVLCQNVTAIADAASRGVVTAYSSGVPSWKVSLPTDVQGYGFGIIPSDQVGSTGTTTLLADDYFLLQVSGPATGLASQTLIKTTAELAPGLAIQSLGLLVVYLNSSVGTVTVTRLFNTGYITNTAAAAVSGTQTCYLSGLI
jgi:hypothetical protein